MNTTEYRQPTHREELERELVHGASSQIAHAPENAAAIAKGIKTVLDELAPVAPHPVAIAPLPAMDHGTSLKFGQALEAIQAGQRIARTGWNGKGMFVYFVPPASYPVQTGAAKAHFGKGAMVPYNAYMAIKNVDGTVSTWVPSVNDCLASDWGVVGESEQAASTVPPHQQRIIDEKAARDSEISRLAVFIDSNPVFPQLPADEQARLRRQLDVMRELSVILGERIAAF